MKNRLTKVLALIGACALTVGCMTGCGSSVKEEKTSDKLNVVTTIFPYYDFVEIQLMKIQ